MCLALLISTLALVTLGGVVRITGSGLGCPDWPLCHGRLIPPLQPAPWIEYIHRLASLVVTLLVLWLALTAWRRYRSERWVFWPAAAAPVLLAAQIVLGRLTVLNEIPPATAWVHTAAAMAIVACVTVPACVAHAGLRSLSARWAAHLSAARGARRLPALFALAAAAVYLLLLTGAYVTRSGASAACVAIPACGPAASSEAARRLMGVHMLHRWAAVAVTLALGGVLTAAWRAAPHDRRLRGWLATVGSLLLAQIGLGAANVLLGLPAWSRAMHLVVAATLWTAVTILAVSLWRGQEAAFLEPSRTGMRRAEAGHP